MRLDPVDELDVIIPSMAPRSRLFRLPPVHETTGYREGLVSYVVRLARAHCVSPRRLFRDVLSQSEIAFAQLRYATFFQRYAGTVDGLGSYAQLASQTLTALTGGIAAQSMTLLPLQAVLPTNGAGLLTRQPKWCPACISEMVRSEREVSRPLAWSLELYRICHVHGHALTTLCRRCGRAQPFIPHYPDLGRCAHCRFPLGSATEYQCDTADDNAVSGLGRWVSGAIADLVEHLHEYADAATQKTVAAFVSDAIASHTSGNRAAFCRALGLPPWTFTKWLAHGERPTLPQVLTVCYGLQIFPSAIFLAESPDNSAGYALRRVPEKLFQRAARPLLTANDRHRVGAALDAIVSDPNDTRPLAEIARGLGQSRSCLSYWFPESCAVIRAKHRASQNGRAADRRQAEQAAVMQVVRYLQEHGEYPVRKKVDRALRASGAALIRPELRQAYRSVLEGGRNDDNRSASAMDTQILHDGF